MSRQLNEDFVANYKNSFCSSVVPKAFEGKSTLSGKELLHITPSKQLNFFVMKSLYKEWQDEMKRLESPFFDYRDTEVRKALMQFMNTLSQHISVNQETLQSLMNKALDDCFTLIVAPAAFVRGEFKGRENAEYSPKHAKSILKYVKVLHEEFDDFFNAQAKGSYADVFEIAEDYFADVDLTAAQELMLSALSQVEPIAIDSLLAEEELIDVIEFDEEDLEEETTEEGSMPVSDTKEEEPPVSETPEPEEVAAEKEEVEDADEPTEEPPTAEQQSVAEPAEPEKEEYAEAIETVNDQFQQEEETLATHLEETDPVKSMMSSISVNQQYMFAQELFNGDANTFQKAISELESFESFDESVEHLVSQYARKYDWDMNSDEVKELLKVIFRRFR